MNTSVLLKGDCLELMNEIGDKSIDMILCDLPYGTTACKWDVIIPFDKLWAHYERIIKDNGAIVLFSAEIFTAQLIMSNINLYRYSLVWEKSKVGRFAQAKLRFLNTHEDILIFSKGKCSDNSIIKMKYNPQDLVVISKVMKDNNKNGSREGRKQLPDYIQEYTGYPKSILKFSSEGKTVHPTQKPVPLLEYLIKTYTNTSDLVLDNTMGSGSTGVACCNLNRDFIGIEKEDKYFAIAEQRIAKAEAERLLLDAEVPMPNMGNQDEAA